MNVGVQALFIRKSDHEELDFKGNPQTVTEFFLIFPKNLRNFSKTNDFSALPRTILRMKITATIKFIRKNTRKHPKTTIRLPFLKKNPNLIPAPLPETARFPG